MQPTFNMFESADVISNAGNLSKLFNLLRNRTWMANRYDVELRGDALLISRWNDDPDLSRSFGCGAGFERETCRYDPSADPILQRSASHHRVVSYRFGGLQCVVQAEADAYHCECNHSFTSQPPNPKHKKQRSDPSPLSHAQRSANPRRPFVHPRTRFRSCTSTAALQALALDDPGDSPAFSAAAAAAAAAKPTPTSTATTTAMAAATVTTTPSPTLKIHHLGGPIPARCLVEIKTQHATAPVYATPEAQLYFARRTQLYLAEHRRGRFAPSPDLAVRDMTGELRVWERKEQDMLRRLAGLLREVRQRARVLRESGVERLSLVCEGDGSGRLEGVRVRIGERREEGNGLLPAGRYA